MTLYTHAYRVARLVRSVKESMAIDVIRLSVISLWTRVKE
jgi:hypothetical protein